MNERSQFTNDLADELILMQLLRLQNNRNSDDDGGLAPVIAESKAGLSKDSVGISQRK